MKSWCAQIQRKKLWTCDILQTVFCPFKDVIFTDLKTDLNFLLINHSIQPVRRMISSEERWLNFPSITNNPTKIGHSGFPVNNEHLRCKSI